jgi:hypothetical protein
MQRQARLEQLRARSFTGGTLNIPLILFDKPPGDAAWRGRARLSSRRWHHQKRLRRQGSPLPIPKPPIPAPPAPYARAALPGLSALPYQNRRDGSDHARLHRHGHPQTRRWRGLDLYLKAITPKFSPRLSAAPMEHRQAPNTGLSVTIRIGHIDQRCRFTFCPHANSCARSAIRPWISSSLTPWRSTGRQALSSY